MKQQFLSLSRKARSALANNIASYGLDVCLTLPFPRPVEIRLAPDTMAAFMSWLRRAPYVTRADTNFIAILHVDSSGMGHYNLLLKKPFEKADQERFTQHVYVWWQTTFLSDLNCRKERRRHSPTIRFGHRQVLYFFERVFLNRGGGIDLVNCSPELGPVLCQSAEADAGAHP